MNEEKFQVYALPAGILLPNGQPAGDHTYVMTPSKTWRCLGSQSGGRKLECGNGTIAAATCMGNPEESNWELPENPFTKKFPYSAGIVYGVNGVCHQIANRVLYHTGATVKGAGSYDITSTLYGVYGTFVPAFIAFLFPLVYASLEAVAYGEWMNRTSRCPSQRNAVNSTFEAQVVGLHESVQNVPPRSRAERLEHHLREVELQLKDRLGSKIDNETIRQVKEMMRQEDSQQLAKLSTNTETEIQVDDLAEKHSQAASDMFFKMAGILGENAFFTVYGQDPGNPVNLIDPAAFDVV